MFTLWMKMNDLSLVEENYSFEIEVRVECRRRRWDNNFFPIWELPDLFQLHVEAENNDVGDP